jgi:hypothetical protein
MFIIFNDDVQDPGSSEDTNKLASFPIFIIPSEDQETQMSRHLSELSLFAKKIYEMNQSQPSYIYDSEVKHRLK